MHFFWKAENPCAYILTVMRNQATHNLPCSSLSAVRVLRAPEGTEPSKLDWQRWARLCASIVPPAPLGQFHRKLTLSGYERPQGAEVAPLTMRDVQGRIVTWCPTGEWAETSPSGLQVKGRWK